MLPDFNKYDNMSDRDIVALSGAHTLGPVVHALELVHPG